MPHASGHLPDMTRGHKNKAEEASGCNFDLLGEWPNLLKAQCSLRISTAALCGFQCWERPLSKVLELILS